MIAEGYEAQAKMVDALEKGRGVQIKGIGAQTKLAAVISKPAEAVHELDASRLARAVRMPNQRTG
jgi:hypothetical protein